MLLFPGIVLALYWFLSLVADVMFVNNIPFFITMSCGIKFVTVEYLRTRTAKELSKNLKRVMKLYGRGSMIVQNILMDMEFDSTKDELMGKTVVDTSAAKEHVSKIERCIHTIKERCRAMASDLPFNCLHKTIVINLIYFCILWLNAFPVKNRVSQEFSPQFIVVQTKPSWKIIAALNLGVMPRSTMNPILAIQSPHAPTQKFLWVPLKISTVPSSFFSDYGAYSEAPQLHEVSHAWLNYRKTNTWGKKTKQ